MRDNTFSEPEDGGWLTDRWMAVLLALVIVGGSVAWWSRGPDLTSDQAAAARVAQGQLSAYERGDLDAMCSRMLEWDTKATSILQATAQAHGGIGAYADVPGLGTQLTGSASERCVHFHSVSRYWADKGEKLEHASSRPQQASPVVNERTVLTYGYGRGEGTVVMTMRRVDGRWMQERPATFMPD